MSSHTVDRVMAGAVARDDGHPRGGSLGAVPWIALACAAGVACASGADALSRTGHAGGQALFWLAVALILLPAGLRQATSGVGSGERAATLVLVGLALYAIKVLRDPFAFTYGDELAHLHNLQAILGSGRLFTANTILPITPRYPGLESVAAAITSAGGVSTFTAGVLEVAVARVIEVLALYMFYERVSGSARAAGLGALVYTATPTFVFFSAQFSYESLALPLAIAGLFALMRWGQSGERAGRRRWGLIVLLLAAAVIPTHHVTSYYLIAFLVSVCLLHWAMHGRRGTPWRLAAGVTVLTAAWLVLVAGRTVGYLTPVLSAALRNVIQTISRESSTRPLFGAQAGAPQTPVDERVLALFGIALLGLGILAGLVAIRRSRRRGPALVFLALSAVAYIGTLPLRFIPAAWETASRAGEFLFIGVGLTVALGLLWCFERGAGERPRRRALAAVAIAIIFASGVIAGWPSAERLAWTRRVVADGRALDPPALVAARWSGAALGHAQRAFAETADARLLVVNGHQAAYEGSNPDAEDVLNLPAIHSWMRDLLRKNRITLVMSDRRKISTDNIVGFFWDVGRPELRPSSTQTKFDLPNVDRLYDGGNIAIYGVRALW